MFRRSGVLPKGSDDGASSGSSTPSCRPEQQKANGNVGGRARAAAQGDRARGEAARERALRRRTRRAKVVEAEREKLARYRRELDAISD